MVWFGVGLLTLEFETGLHMWDVRTHTHATLTKAIIDEAVNERWMYLSRIKMNINDGIIIDSWKLREK